jgi:3-hydroxybutyryl-CoA dehydrogenase
MNTKIAVIGAGQMGSGIAHVCAASGYEVVLIDVSEEALAAARSSIARNMERQVRKGTMNEDQRAEALARIASSTSLEAVRDVAVAIEAVSEDRQLKYRLFEQLDALLPPGAILASNTSSISITALAARTDRPEVVIGMHFMNPVPVMSLVEIVRGLATAPETVQRTADLARALGKTPVEVNDSPGFVSNRVLLPMINEAVYCLMEGVAQPEAIDTVMKLGMNHPMGPLALADLIGLDTCLAILEVLHDELGEDKYRPCPLLRRYVAAGWLGRKSGRGFYRYES